MPKIPGGYYIKARKIQASEIATQPPHVREIWDWLIMHANHKAKVIGGKTIERGQILTSCKEIREGLCWYVGYRKETYLTSSCENALKYLRKGEMIATTKTTRGVLVTVLNYDCYQNPDNYESRTESRNENGNDAGVMPNDKQECKNGRSKNETKTKHSSKVFDADSSGVNADDAVEFFDEFWKAYPKKINKAGAIRKWKALKVGSVLCEKIMSGLEREKQWRSTANGRFRPEWKHPSAWLNNAYWENDYNDYPESSPSKPAYLSERERKEQELIDSLPPAKNGRQ